MTEMHLKALAMAVMVAVVSIAAACALKDPQASKDIAALGVGFAGMMTTGVLGHAQGQREQMRRASDAPTVGPEDKVE